MQILLVVFALAIFSSAFLLFQIQPILGKVILPIFGGTASTWVICMIFFQFMLLLGYLYSHSLEKFFSAKKQGYIHLAVLGASALLFPANFDFKKILFPESPIPSIFYFLFVSIALPYFVLSTTGPLLQSWYNKEKSGSLTYRLFALSNFGSLLALISYPLLFEPILSLDNQGHLWKISFWIFTLSCGFLAYRLTKKSDDRTKAETIDENLKPKLGQKIMWILLAFCPSVLLLASTVHLTQNLAPIPLLWIMPLVLYLLSFILCFESQRWYHRNVYILLFAASIGCLHYIQTLDVGHLKLVYSVPLILLCSFIVFMVCHGELAMKKPDPRFLTLYYLMISVGGVLGGIFVGVISPNVFRSDYELSIGLVLVSILIFYIYYSEKDCFIHRFPKYSGLTLGFMGIAILILVNYEFHDLKIKTSLRLARNFYGTLRVKQDEILNKRTLYHGIIIHGEQHFDEKLRNIPTTYYGAGTGAEYAIMKTRTKEPQRVGVVGLGTGTLSSYAREKDYYRIYEINSLMVDISKNQFSYLTGGQGKKELIMGDARQSMANEPAQNLDTLLIDAFSGDAIPIHLLTYEAIQLYLHHLQPKGLLAVHISNKYLNLAPVVKLSAAKLGKQVFVIDNEDDNAKYVYGSTWVIINNGPTIELANDSSYHFYEIDDAPRLKMWTDSYSSIYAILK